jgi:hypothetical protein
MPENDVIEVLLHQHGLIHDLFDEVRLLRLLAVHETIEEEVVHPYARAKMAKAAKAAAAMAPTHPHPGVESATKNMLLGPPTAMVDRVRDMIRKVTD